TVAARNFANGPNLIARTTQIDRDDRDGASAARRPQGCEVVSPTPSRRVHQHGADTCELAGRDQVRTPVRRNDRFRPIGLQTMPCGHQSHRERLRSGAEEPDAPTPAPGSNTFLCKRGRHAPSADGATNWGQLHAGGGARAGGWNTRMIQKRSRTTPSTMLPEYPRRRHNTNKADSLKYSIRTRKMPLSLAPRRSERFTHLRSLGVRMACVLRPCGLASSSITRNRRQDPSSNEVSIGSL